MMVGGCADGWRSVLIVGTRFSMQLGFQRSRIVSLAAVIATSVSDEAIQFSLVTLDCFENLLSDRRSRAGWPTMTELSRLFSG